MALSEAEIQQAKLLENFSSIKHGDTETLRSERSRIIESLNEITHKVFGQSFVKYCMPDAPSTDKDALDKPISMYEMQSLDYIKVVQRNAEEAYKIFSIEGLWQERCNSIHISFKHIYTLLIYDNNSISLLNIHLTFLHEKIFELLTSLFYFCPKCSKTTKEVRKQHQEICDLLMLIMQRCKN